ncbi:MAG: ThiF family adenylyltransferase [Flavobacteriales bacterium]|nr:ThiF family adenylyltransferase [Flavobacteriales bacterium]
MSLQQGIGARNVRIAIIGAGGTGCALLPLVGAMDVHAITVIDGDTVEAKNLTRQLLYATDDVGRAKAEAAVQRMQAMRRDVRWIAEHRFVDARNITALLQGSAVVADCTDDLAARALIERTCRELRIPLVSGAVHGHQVQVITCSGEQHMRQRSGFFQGRTSEDQLGCDMRDVPAAVTTLTASLMALRIADILKGGDGLAGVMDLVDAGHGRWMRIMGPEAGEFMDTPIDPMHHA